MHLFLFFRIVDLMPGWNAKNPPMHLQTSRCAITRIAAPSMPLPFWKPDYFFFGRQLVGSMFQSQQTRKSPPQHPPHIAYLWLQGRLEV